MIRTFRDRETEMIFRGRRSCRLPPDIQQPARRKMSAIDAAAVVLELANPRGNRLEEVKGDRKGTYSLRINDQWRLAFRWSDGGADDVRIEDYHR